MFAFHNSPSLKMAKLAQVKAHEIADEIVKGKYWEHGKGCAVGCTVHSSDHGAYETEMGIPRVLARLEETIFERMSNAGAAAYQETYDRYPELLIKLLSEAPVPSAAVAA